MQKHFRFPYANMKMQKICQDTRNSRTHSDSFGCIKMSHDAQNDAPFYASMSQANRSRKSLRCVKSMVWNYLTEREHVHYEVHGSKHCAFRNSMTDRGGEGAVGSDKVMVVGSNTTWLYYMICQLCQWAWRGQENTCQLDLINNNNDTIRTTTIILIILKRQNVAH